MAVGPHHCNVIWTAVSGKCLTLDDHVHRECICKSHQPFRFDETNLQPLVHKAFSPKMAALSTRAPRLIEPCKTNINLMARMGSLVRTVIDDEEVHRRRVAFGKTALISRCGSAIQTERVSLVGPCTIADDLFR